MTVSNAVNQSLINTFLHRGLNKLDLSHKSVASAGNGSDDSLPLSGVI